MQFATADSIAGLYIPIIKVRPWLSLFFMPLLFIVTIELMNLVTAILVESALDRSKEDQDLVRKQRQAQISSVKPRLYEIFEKIDKDHTGQATLQEVMQWCGDVPEELSAFVTPEHLVSLFEVLDVDQTGGVEQGEFVNGLLKLMLSEVPVETLQMLRMMKSMRQKMSSVDVSLQEMYNMILLPPETDEASFSQRLDTRASL